MLALYALDGDPALYRSPPTTHATRRPAQPTAKACTCSPGTAKRCPRIDAQPGMLQTQAATTSLFAWLAVYPPPTP